MSSRGKDSLSKSKALPRFKSRAYRMDRRTCQCPALKTGNQKPRIETWRGFGVSEIARPQQHIHLAGGFLLLGFFRVAVAIMTIKVLPDCDRYLCVQSPDFLFC